MAYSLQLTRYQVENIDWLRYGTYRMRVEVTSVDGGMDPDVFVYQRRPLSPYMSEPCDRFVAIAGPAQLADIPVGEPDTASYGPFFRLSWIELDFTAEKLAMEVWEIIKAEVAVLCQSMTRFENLRVAEEIVISSTSNSDDEAEISEVSESMSESASEW